MCNADGLITSYNTGYPGSTHDAFIWSDCAFRTRFEAGEFGENYLLGKCLDNHVVEPDREVILGLR